MLNMKKAIKVTVVAGTVAVSSLAIGFTSPASAMPKQEFKQLCGWSGGNYQSMGRGACSYEDGTVLINNFD